MEFFWPSDLPPTRQTWGIVDAGGIFTAPVSGVTRTVSRPGTRVTCKMSFENLAQSQRHRVMALMAALRGRVNRIWIPDFGTNLRGSFPATELLSNVAFDGNTTGWTSSNAELVLTPDSGRMRLSRTGVVADRYAYASITTVSGAQYLFRSGMIQGRAAPSYALQLGTTTTGAELGASAQATSQGQTHVVGAATGTTSYASVKDYIASRAADYFQLLDSPSVARCALVNGAAQSGSGLLIDGLPASTNGLLYAGDVVAVYTGRWEMKRLTMDLNSNSGGAGYMVFEPVLRSSPADNAPVAIYRPMARFLFAGQNMEWETKPGYYSSFDLEFVEDIFNT